MDKPDLRAALVDEAKSRLWVREIGTSNRGAEIDKFNGLLNDSLGHAWCASFVAYCVAEVERKHNFKSSLVKSESVMQMWNRSISNRSSYQKPGDIVCWKKRNTALGHCGIVVDVDPKGEWFQTVEGNTFGDEAFSREGNGVFLKRRYVAPPPPGFLLVGFLDAFKLAP